MASTDRVGAETVHGRAAGCTDDGDGRGDRRRSRSSPALDAAARERLSRAAADIAPRRRASTPRTRAASARCSPSSRAASRRSSRSTASSASSASATPATSSARCRSSLGTVFPVGFRAAEPSRVMRIEPRDYHAVAAVAPDVAAEVGQARRAPDERLARPAGHRRRAAAAARDRGRPPLGRAPAPSCGASSTATRSRSAGSRPTRRTPRSCGAARCRRTSDLPGDPRRRRQDRGAAAAAPGRRAARPRHRAGARRSTTR